MISASVLTALLLCAAFNLVLALRVLLRDAPAPVDLRRVLQAVGLVAGLNVVQVPLLVLLVQLHPFGVVHLAWLELTAVAPLCGVAVVTARARGRAVGAGALAAAVVSFLALPLVVQAQFVTPYDLRVERVTVSVPAAREGDAPLVIGVLADLQTPTVGEHERAAVARLMEGAPDLVLVPGDVYQGNSEHFEEVVDDFRALLSQLQAPGGVWVVPGNTDYLEGLPRLVEGTGARLLLDETVELRVRDRRVTLHGVDEETFARRDFRVPELLAFDARDDAGDIRLVLSHRPRVVESLPPACRTDLVVAGHTHGGQVALPWLGPPLVLSPLPNRVGAGGLHELDGRRLYVSRGVGMERHQAPRIRFGAPPEVTLLTLESVPAP